jgi:hypothetical protein
MRLPIKLNRAGWPSSFQRLSFSVSDPRPLADDISKLPSVEFSAAISALQFGVTFKTTFPGRQRNSNAYLLAAYRGSKPTILDVGASDGSTSLDLIRVLDGNFNRYFVTDLNISASCGTDYRKNVYFRDASGDCILRASKRFIVYSNVAGARAPLPFIARRLISRAQRVTNWRELLLIQPELLRVAAADSRIVITRYDMFSPWSGPAPDVIKIANLLNRKYFSEDEMRGALQVQCSHLAIGGRLLLVSEDDGIEKFSVFRKNATGMRLEHTHAGGAKAAPYVPVEEIPDCVRSAS